MSYPKEAYDTPEQVRRDQDMLTKARIDRAMYGTQLETAGQTGREMTVEEKIDELFTYHPPSGTEQAAKYEIVRDAAKYFAKVIVKCTPQGSDRSAAIRHLREAVMTANAAIALNGLNL